MSDTYLSEKETIEQELTAMRFCWELPEIATGDDNITGRIIMQRLEEYGELLRRLMEIEREEE